VVGSSVQRDYGCDEMTECILFAGYKKSDGYGWCTYKGKQMGAHRATWIKKFGSIPDGMHVLHKCDNPPCINIEHLYLGTHGQNMKDKAVRGRVKVAKLSGTDAVTIRNLRDGGMFLKDIAAKFNVTYQAIHHVCTGRSHKYD
jgi:hypothetical protein